MITPYGEIVIHSAVWEQPPMRAALARRDIGAVYRMLTRAGVSQRQIAHQTGQAQSEVSEIMQGRQVMGYAVLARIAEGLGIPRGLMGLACAQRCAPQPPPIKEVDEKAKARALLAVASTALFGRPVLGAVLQLPTQEEPPTPLPSRLAMADVTALQEMTRRLEIVAKAYGGSADMLSPVAAHAERLLRVPGSEAIKRDLAGAIAELHTVAGWAAFDARQDKTALYHFIRAMELGADTVDGFAFSKAVYLAGVATAERGHYNDGLKLLQLGRISLDSVPPTPRTRELTSWLAADSADVLARMDQVAAARSELAAARDSWRAPDADDQADMSWVTALVELTLGRLEMAARLVAASVRHWEGTADRRQAALGGITLAIIHVRAGEPDAHELAHQAITTVARLRSVRARDRLAPLAAELESRRSTAAWRLAGLARRVMANSA
ncbi:MAG: helix-turn-helix domain-containing protein [Pseudonocardiaceae bacterium]